MPASTVGMTDQMSFVERLRNFLFYLYTDLFFWKFWRDEWDGYYSNVLGKAAAEQPLSHRLCLLNALRAWCYRITLLSPDVSQLCWWSPWRCSPTLEGIMRGSFQLWQEKGEGLWRRPWISAKEDTSPCSVTAMSPFWFCTSILTHNCIHLL